MYFLLPFSSSKEILKKICLNTILTETLKLVYLRIFLITILPFILFKNSFQLTEHHTVSVATIQL